MGDLNMPEETGQRDERNHDGDRERKFYGYEYRDGSRV
jgi:hypothetical protein